MKLRRIVLIVVVLLVFACLAVVGVLAGGASFLTNNVNDVVRPLVATAYLNMTFPPPTGTPVKINIPLPEPPPQVPLSTDVPNAGPTLLPTIAVPSYGGTAMPPAQQTEIAAITATSERAWQNFRDMNATGDALSERHLLTVTVQWANLTKTAAAKK